MLHPHDHCLVLRKVLIKCTSFPSRVLVKDSGNRGALRPCAGTLAGFWQGLDWSLDRILMPFVVSDVTFLLFLNLKENKYKYIYRKEGGGEDVVE